MEVSVSASILPDPRSAIRGFWSGQLDSNQRPAVPKTAALPGCAIPRITLGNDVDTRLRRDQQGADDRFTCH
jgi:hypothetical protein